MLVSLLPLLALVPSPSGTGVLEVPQGWCAEVLGSGQITDRDETFFSYTLDEGEAGADLNGDGDFTDSVHAVSFGSAAPIVTDLAGVFAWVALDPDGSPWALLAVEESMQAGLDVNGDGDSADTYYVLMDVATGDLFFSGVTTGSLTGALLPPDNEPLFGRDGFVLRRIEADESLASGTLVDLNQDGDNVDVLYWGWSRQTGISGPIIEGARFGDRMLPGGLAVLGACETQQDLNGDGAADEDCVPAVFDLGTSQLAFLPWALPADGLLDFSVGGGFDFFQVSEFAQGQVDLNGDGDTADSILLAFDPVSGAVSSTGFATGAKGGASTRTILQGKGATALVIQDAPLISGTADTAIYLFDWSNGRSEVFASAPAFELARFEDNYVFLQVVEDPGADLNGDGKQNTATLVYRRGDGTSAALPFAAEVVHGSSNLAALAVDGAIAAYSRSEVFEDADLDGDGVIRSDVGFYLDLETEVLEVLVGGVTSMGALGGAVFSSVRESLSGTDLDMDGLIESDPAGYGVHFRDVATGTSSILPWGQSELTFANKSVVVVQTTESGNGDLNGDGDATDGEILVALRPQ